MVGDTYSQFETRYRYFFNDACKRRNGLGLCGMACGMTAEWLRMPIATFIFATILVCDIFLCLSNCDRMIWIVKIYIYIFFNSVCHLVPVIVIMREDDDFAGSYLRFSACYVKPKFQKYHHSIQWNNISKTFLTIVLVNVNIIAIYSLCRAGFESQARWLSL